MRTPNLIKTVSTAMTLAVAVSAFAQTNDAGLVKRPEQLKFPALVYEPPAAKDFRTVLKSGPVAYLVPDRELPLVNIVIYVHTGSYLEPVGKEGLAGMTGYLIAAGGTKSKTAEELDERTAYLAANLNSGIGDTQGTVSLNLLSKDLDEGLAILREVVTAPRYQDNKITLYKQQSLQGMKQRNDESEAIEGREYNFLALGEGFWKNRHSTAASLDSITKEDLQAFHRKWFVPGNFVVAVSGDFDKADMTARLEKLFADWPFTGEKPSPIPDDPKLAPAGVYIVDKDVNQGRVSILLPGIMRQDPDYFSVQVMNDILGGGGFTSHIMSSVRSDEGLAYSAYSSFPGGVYYSSDFTAEFQSKSRTVTYAASIVLKELQKMTEIPATDMEMKVSQHGIIDRFPHNFATKAQVASIFATDEFTGRYARDPEYFHKYRSRIESVTKDDVQRVAKKYLTPDRAVILIVGQKKEIEMKLPAHPTTLQELTKGPVKELPLRDPLTMKPLPLKDSSASESK